MGASKTVNNTSTYIDSYDLSAYAGQNKRIAIHCESDPDMGVLAFPNFSVTNGTQVDVKENITQEEMIYPNPAKDVLYFSESFSALEIYSVTGQLVYHERLSADNHSISVSQLEVGIYTIRLIGADGSIHIQRLIKQ